MNSTATTVESASLQSFLDRAYEISNWGMRLLVDAQPNGEIGRYGSPKLVQTPEKIYIGRTSDGATVGVYRHQGDKGPEYSLVVVKGSFNVVADFPLDDRSGEDKIRELYKYIESGSQHLKLTA